MRSSILKRLIVSCSVVVLMLVLLFTMIVTSPGERYIRHRIENELGEALGTVVQVGGLETNLISRVQLRDVDVYHSDGARLLRLKYGCINYRLWDLLRRGISIRAIQIDSLFVSVKRDSAGRLILPFLKQQDGSNSVKTDPLKVRLGGLNIRNAVISYDDRQIPMHGTVYGIDFRGVHQQTNIYEWHASSDSVKFKFKGKDLPTAKLNATGRISPEHWEVQRLEVTTSHLRLSGQAAGEVMGRRPTVRGIFSLEGRVHGTRNFIDDVVPKSLSPVRGELKATWILDGTRDDPRLVGDVQILNASLGGVFIPNGQLRASWQDSLFSLEHLDVAVMGGRLFGNGYVTLDSMVDHRLSLNIDGVKFSSLWKTIHQDTVYPGGMIEGQWVSSGPFTSLYELQVESRLYLTQVRYQTKILPNLNVTISVKPESAVVFLTQEENWLEWKWENTNGKTGGAYCFDIPRMEYLAEVLNIQDLTGTIRGKGLMKGAIDNPEIVMDVWGEDIRYQHFPMDSLYVSAIYKDRWLFFKNSRFSGQRSLADTLRSVFQFPGFRGGFVYRGWMSGSITSPEGEVEARFLKPGFGDLLWDEGDLHLAMSNAQLHLDVLTLRKDSLLVKAAGSCRIPSAEGRLDVSFFRRSLIKDRSEEAIKSSTDQFSDSSCFGRMTAYFDKESEENWRIHAKGMGIRLDNMIEFYQDKSQWEGTFDFELIFTGNKQRPRSSLRFSADSLGMGRVYIDSARGTLELQDGRLAIAPLEFYTHGRKSYAEADFDLVKTPSDGYTLSRESEIRGYAEGKGVDIRFLTPLLGLGIEISGISEYEIEWKGRWGRPRFRGHLNVSNGRFQLKPGTEPIQSIKAKLSLADSTLQISQISGRLRDLPFQIEGRAISSDWPSFRMNARLAVSDVDAMTLEGSKTTDSLDFRIEINDLNLSLFQDFFIDIHRLDGRLTSRLNITGSTKSPQFFGFLEARKLLLHPKAIEYPLSEGIVKMRSENERFMLDTLFFNMNGGAILAGGSAVLAGGEMKALDARIAVDRVKLNRPKVFSLAVQSIRATIKKEQDNYLVDGDVILGESRMTQDVQPGALFPFFQKVERPMSMPPSFFRKTRMDVRVRESDKIWIDNNIAHMRLYSELGLIGTLAQPNLSGRLSVEEGYVLYLDRKFQIKQGVLDFIDPHRINPVVDFKAQADIKSYQTWSRQPYTVSLDIKGPLDQAVMELHSRPPLDRSDIITLLTVGATRAEMTGGNEVGKSSLGNVLEDRIGHISSQRVSGFASRRIGSLLGLEAMTIDGNLFRFGKSWGPQLLASKRITDRMEISYTTRTGHSNEQSIRLDYRLSKILSIEGQTDQQGRSGIDLKFRWKFK